MLSPDEARRLLLEAAVAPAGTELLSLDGNADRLLGRVLAENLSAQCDFPNTARSRMDGYAVCAADTADGAMLPVAGTARPADTAGTLTPGTAWRIYTGGPVPKGADAVVMQEKCSRSGDQVSVPRAGAGDFIRPAGEDFAAGALLVAAGTQLHERHLALAAAGEIGQLTAFARPRIGLMRLGSELRPAGEALPAGAQRDLNFILLNGLAAGLSLELTDFGAVPDAAHILTSKLLAAAQQCDLLLTTGGASVGDEDLLPQILHDRGEVLFHKVAMRPGMPCIAGRLGKASVLGLPGNPVSALVSFCILGRPCVRKMQGITDVHDRRSRYAPGFARLEAAVANALPDRRLWLQAECSPTDSGELTVRCEPVQHSALLSPMARANCLLELAPGQSLSAGDTARILPC